MDNDQQVQQVNQQEGEEEETQKDTFYIIASIPKWKQLPNSQIEYSLQLFSELTNKTWEITKTLNDFDKYNQYLLQAYSDLPVFPDVNYAILNLQKTKVLISFYVTQILNRSDIISNPETDNFFKLTNHLPNMNKTQPFCLGNDDDKESRTSLMCYLDKLDVFIIGYSAKSDLSSLLSSTSYSNSNSAMASELVMKRYNGAKRKMEFVSKVKVDNTNTAITIINYVESVSTDMSFVLVGLSNGTIQVYNTNTSGNSDSGNTIITLEKMSEIKAHNTKLLNIGFDALSGYIYSTSINSTSITISEVNYEKIISTHKISNSYLTAFTYDDERKLVFITDQSFSISIFQVQNSVTFTMLQAFHGTNAKQIDFYYNASMCKFFISNANSELAVYHYILGLNKIDKISVVIVDKGKRNQITGVAYRKFKRELIISLSNGKIQFWSHNSDYPEYVIDCCVSHSHNGIIYIDQGDMLISCCGDSMKKYWLLPEIWPGEQMRKNEHSIFEGKNEPNPKDIMHINKAASKGKEEEEVICIIDEGTMTTINNEENDSSYLDGWDCDVEEKPIKTSELMLPMMF